MFRILLLILIIPIFGVTQEASELSKIHSLSDFDGEPSSFVNGCVNAISGNFTETVSPFVMPGIQPIEFNFSHTSDWTDNESGPYVDWYYMNHAYYDCHYVADDSTKRGYFKDEYGSTVGLKDINSMEDGIDTETLNQGVTNSSSGIISGRNNLMNLKVHTYWTGCQITSGGGVVYEFWKDKVPGDPTMFEKIKRPNGMNTTFHVITTKNKKEKFQKVIKRNFNRRGALLSEITRTLDFNNDTDHFITNDDHELLVKEEVVDIRNKAVEVVSNYAPKVNYYFTRGHSPRKLRMTRKELPDQRVLEISYYQKGKNEWGNGILSTKHRYPRGRVCQLKEPVGHDANLISTYRFKYEVEGHREDAYCRLYGNCRTTTTVYDALGHKTEYEISRDQRLDNIKKYRGSEENTTLFSQEILQWQGLKGPPYMYLRSRSLVDENDHIHLSRKFEYDDHGNVIRNTITGNLTGGSPILKQDKNTTYHEAITTHYTYTDFNLMASEDNGKRQIRYKYHYKSEYLKVKYVVVQNKIVERTFYEYDDGGAVLLEISDDGSAEDRSDLANVTERHIKRFTNTQKLPAGLPCDVSEYYYDIATGHEVLLRRVVSTYDKQGHLLKEDYYDANNTCAYSLTWEYDTFGNLISETNPLGLTTCYQYDANNNRIYEQGPNPLYHLEYAYDFVNRLIREEKVTADGQRFATHYKYDYLGNRVSSVDFLGNETKYEYDEFKRLTKTIYPDVLDKSGNKTAPTVTIEPTFLGFAGTNTDADGAVTKCSYNARGDPSKILYPNGSQEIRRYFPTGELHKVIAPNNTLTAYEYDALGRPIKTEIYDGSNKLLSRTKNVYNNLHLIEEHDPEGNTTYYKYDGAGRLCRKEMGDAATTYHYDVLGRMNEERRWIDPERYLAFIKVFDLLNRIVEERIEDEQGEVFTKLAFTYDEEGKILEKLYWNENGLAIESQCYDAMGNIVEHVDPSGNKTTTIYHYDHVNALGQYVASSEIINPLGVTTFTVHDALGRIVSVKKTDLLGETIQEKQLFYDLSGRLLKQVEEVIGRKRPPLTTLFSHDCMGRITAITEAAGTTVARTVKHLYNKFGQKTADIKPDGVRVNYGYDALGRVVTASSSDGTIDYSYEYDVLNRLTAVYDKIHDLTTTKSYDGLGHLVQEKLANGHVISYEYDGLGRELSVTLPDQSGIGYDYDARMRAVHRYDANGNQLYSHTYDSFDNAGNLLQETFLQNGGQRTFDWNINGQITAIKSAAWNETEIAYDSLGNMTQKSVQGVPSVYQYDGLAQLTNEQGDVSHEYRYDSLYNRISKDKTRCKVNSLNQLLQAGDTSYKYDRSGRLVEISDEGKTKKFVYDAFDRLVSVDDDGEVTAYIYDAENRRVSKRKADGEILHYIYQGQRDIGCSDADGVVKELRLLGLTKGAELGAAVALEVEGRTYAPIHDHNGNLTALVDPLTGELVETYDYTAFGEGSEGEKISPWRFSSKRMDDETGFYYFGRRYYDPGTARWITKDPLGFEGGPNLYAYVLNNPVNRCDFYGLETSDGFEQGEWEAPDKPKGFFSRVRETIGDVICFIADHCLPIPYVRQGLSYVGHRIAGRSHEFAMKQITPVHSQNRQFKGAGTSVQLPKVSLIATNGVNTLFHAAGHFFVQLSNAYGCAVVNGTYNASHGFLFDIMECVASHLGISTHADKMLVKNIRSCIARMGGVEGGGMIYLHAHSQGGLISYLALKMLTPEERAMIDVTTYGSAKMISGMGLAGSRNYINSDLVPYISDPIGVIKGMLSKDSNIMYIRREKSFPGGAHAVLSHYYGAIKQDGVKFQKKYGLE